MNVNTGTDQKNILETYKEAMMKFVEEKKTLLESANKNGEVIDVKEVINLGVNK